MVLHVSTQQRQGYIWAKHLDCIPFADRVTTTQSWLTLQSPPQLISHCCRRCEESLYHFRSHLESIWCCHPGDRYKRSCLARFSNEGELTGSGSRAPCRLLWYQIRASSVEAMLICDWDLIYFSPSLGIFTHCCQETIYSDCFKDIVNIYCCTHIKQEALVLGTAVRSLLILAV